MRRNYHLKILSILVAVLGFTLAIGNAHAAPQDITISPTSNSPVINPGEVYNGSFQVINQGKSAYKFQTYSAPYHVSGENYTPDFTPIANAPNPSSWFKFSINSANINPTQSITIDYSITVPKTTLPGAYFGVAFAQTQFPKVPNAITLNERVGEIFYIRAAGPVKQGGELLTWQSGMFQEPPLTSTIRLEDTGALNFPATIQFSVKDIFGQSKYSLSTVKEVLPQTIRRVTIPWDKTPSIGIFKVGGTVSFLGHTHTLPTRWVLVMSHTVRLYLLIVVIVLALLIVIRFIYRVTHKSKKSKPKRIK